MGLTMVKKRICFTILILFLLFFLVSIQLVSANFACGIVKDSEENISAAWMDVNVYYSEAPDKITTCKVSPAEGKYCCDPQDIKGVSWAIGKEINAEILDIQKGYVAGPVSLIVTGEGYDLFPDMQIEKAIKIHSLSNGEIINTSRIFVNVSVASIFNKISYSLYLNDSSELNSSLIEVCSNCSHAEFYLENLTFGTYYLTLTASGFKGNISSRIYFTKPYQISFGRKIECKGCTENYVPSGRRVKITIFVNSSEPLFGALTDYFPSDWKYIPSKSNEEEVFELFSESHNMIKWEINGTNIEKTYTLKSPKNFITRKYFFQSEFGGYKSKIYDVILFRFYKFFSFKKKFLEDRIKLENILRYSHVSEHEPIVIFFKDSYLSELAIFSNTSQDNVHAYIKKLKNFKPKLKNSERPFEIFSNIPEENIEKILLRFRVEKPEKDSMLENVSLFSYNEDSETWKKLNSSFYKEDEKYSYYEAYVFSKGVFTIKSKYVKINEKKKENKENE